MEYPHITEALCSTAWAILPEKMDMILSVVNARNNGVEFEAAKRRATKFTNRKGDIGIIQAYGTISQRPSAFPSGGTSTERIGAMFDEAINDPSIGTIVFDVDSPGGSVNGVTELSNKIYGARGRKPIIAVVNSMMASAAVWAFTAADEIVITPSGQIGSIGVLAVHSETSKMDEGLGIKTTLIHAGKYKVEANPYQPLEDEARSEMQKHVDKYYGMFVDDVARNRGVKRSVVESDFGQGRMFLSSDAIKVGLADRIGTLEQVVADLHRPTGNRTSAALDVIKIKGRR